MTTIYIKLRILLTEVVNKHIILLIFSVNVIIFTFLDGDAALM